MGDSVDTYYDSGTLTLITHWWPPNFHVQKDKVAACRTIRIKRVELAKMATTTEISNKREGGKLLFLYLSS